jgi:hypothetical protein
MGPYDEDIRQIVAEHGRLSAHVSVHARDAEQ